MAEITEPRFRDSFKVPGQAPGGCLARRILITVPPKPWARIGNAARQINHVIEWKALKWQGESPWGRTIRHSGAGVFWRGQS